MECPSPLSLLLLTLSVVSIGDSGDFSLFWVDLEMLVLILMVPLLVILRLVLVSLMVQAVWLVLGNPLFSFFESLLSSPRRLVFGLDPVPYFLPLFPWLADSGWLR